MRGFFMSIGDTKKSNNSFSAQSNSKINRGNYQSINQIINKQITFSS
jgi:hypothetical protein